MQFWKSVRVALGESDIVVEVLDARAVELSRSKDIEDIIYKHDKLFLLAINKSDLLSQQQLTYLRNQYPDAVFVSGVRNTGLRQLKERIYTLAQQHGISDPHVCFVGYPNVGKSSVINALAKRARAKTSPKAGTTRGIQWVRVGDIRVLDTPGVIPVDIRDETRMALLAARDPEDMREPVKAALALMRYLKENYPRTYTELFGDNQDINDGFEHYGKVKKYFLKDGELNYAKIATEILRAWQRGRVSVS